MADLLKELLDIIFKESNKTWINNIRVRSVCKSWQNSISAFDSTIAQSSPGFESIPGYETYTSKISEKTLYCLKPVESSSLESWFICVEEFKDSKGGKKFRLVNPLTGMHYKKLPSIFPKKLNMYDIHLQELKKFYYLQDVYVTYTDVYVNYTDVYVNINEKTLFLSDSTNNKTGLAVLRQNGITTFFKLVDEKWTRVRNIYDVKDIANYKGKVCVYTIAQDTIMVDSSLKSTTHKKDKSGYDYKPSFLVESLEDLFLVNLLPAIRVYKLHEEKMWIEVTNIGERVFFVGPWSFSVPYLVALGLKNCIVITSRWGEVYVYYMGIRVLTEMDRKYANMFWPPPDWLTQAAE